MADLTSVTAVPTAVPVDFDSFIHARYADLIDDFRWVTKSGLEPEDVVHDALLLVAARFASRDFATEDLLYGYCHVIGLNVVRALLGPAAYARTEVTSDDPARFGQSQGHDTEATAIRNADLARTLDALPYHYRQVLVLAGDGFDSALIAQVLHLRSPEAARRLLHRARRRAQRNLSPALPAVVIRAAWRFLHKAQQSTPADAGPAAAPVVNGTALAAVVAVALVANLGGTAPAPEAPRRVPNRAGAPHAPDLRGSSALTLSGSKSAGGRDGVGASRPPAALPAVRRPSTPHVRVPVTVTSTCAPGVCVGDGTQPGDTIAIQGFGDEVPGVTENVTPVCEYVVANPAVTCTRQEPDHWKVK